MMTNKERFELFLAALLAEFPALSFGYIGNCGANYDDRSWRIFLPHPGRVGTYADSIGGYSTTTYVESFLKNWPSVVARVRIEMAKPERQVRVFGIEFDGIEGVGRTVSKSLSCFDLLKTRMDCRDYYADRNARVVEMLPFGQTREV